MSTIRLFPDSIINRLLIHTVTLRKRTKTPIESRWGDSEHTWVEYEIKCMFDHWRRGEELISELKGIADVGDARAWVKKEHETEDGTITAEKNDELVHEGEYFRIIQRLAMIDGTGGRMYELRLEKVRQ